MKVDVLREYNPGPLDLQGIFSNLALASHRLSQNPSVLAINTKRAILKATALTGHENLLAADYDVFAISTPAETFKLA